MYLPGFRTRTGFAASVMAVLSSREELALMVLVREGRGTQHQESETLKPVGPSVGGAVGTCGGCAGCWFPAQLCLILLAVPAALLCCCSFLSGPLSSVRAVSFTSVCLIVVFIMRVETGISY